MVTCGRHAEFHLAKPMQAGPPGERRPVAALQMPVLRTCGCRWPRPRDMAVDGSAGGPRRGNGPRLEVEILGGSRGVRSRWQARESLRRDELERDGFALPRTRMSDLESLRAGASALARQVRSAGRAVLARLS